MDDSRRRRAILALAEFDLVEMKPTAQYGLTALGRELLDQLEVMQELDDRESDRPGAPGEQTGAVTPSDGGRRGDDDSAPRRARRPETTRRR